MVSVPLRLSADPEAFNYYVFSYLVWIISNDRQNYNEPDLNLRTNTYMDGLSQIQRFGMIDYIAHQEGTFSRMEIKTKYV